MYNTYDFQSNFYPKVIKEKILTDQSIRLRLHKHNYIYFSKDYDTDKVNIWFELNGKDTNSQFDDFSVKIQQIDTNLLENVKLKYGIMVKKELNDLEKVIEILRNNVAIR